MSKSSWNPRFAAYAASRGLTPEEASQECKNRKSGQMTDFIVWINSRWQEWRSINKIDQFSTLSEADHIAFDAWLSNNNLEHPCAPTS